MRHAVEYVLGVGNGVASGVGELLGVSHGSGVAIGGSGDGTRIRERRPFRDGAPLPVSEGHAAVG